MQLTRELERFFAPYSATVLAVEEVRRSNFERIPAPGNGLLRAFTAHVLFHNTGLFGSGGDYLTDVHPRLMILQQRLAGHLRALGMEVSGPEAERTVTIMPYPDPGGAAGEALPPTTRYSRGFRIIPTETLLADTSLYYAHLIDSYGPLVGVLTNNGTVVGPDGGLIAAATAAGKGTRGRLRVLELGSGAGSTALVLARQGKLAWYRGNDFSEEMVDHFHQVTTPQLARLGVDASVLAGSCFDIPLECGVDLLSVGIYYQAQPSLFDRRGAELAACVGETGLLIVQSGMLEDPFVTHLLAGPPCQNTHWPWYSPDYYLGNHFAYIAQYTLQEETILVATNNRSRFHEFNRWACQGKGLVRMVPGRRDARLLAHERIRRQA